MRVFFNRSLNQRFILISRNPLLFTDRGARTIWRQDLGPDRRTNSGPATAAAGQELGLRGEPERDVRDVHRRCRISALPLLCHGGVSVQRKLVKISTK